MRKRKSSAQSFMEYALLVAVAAGVLMAMRIYTVRVVQEKYRQSADIFGQGEQYEKGVTVVTNLDGDTTTLSPESLQTKSCSFVVSRTAELEKQIKDLKAKAETWDKSAAETEAQIPALKAKAEALTAEANQKEIKANNLRTQAATLNAQADVIQAQIDQCQINPVYDESICGRIPELEEEISGLRSQAESWRKEATQLEAEVKSLRSQAESLNNSIAKLAEQIQNLRAMAKGFRKEADDKGAQITQYRNDYPKCF